MEDEFYGLHSTVGDYEGFESDGRQAPISFGSDSEQMMMMFSATTSSALSSDGAPPPPNSVQTSKVTGEGGLEEKEISSAIRAKIASHPLYPKLLLSYVDCQKVGASPEISNMLDEICREKDVLLSGRNAAVSTCLEDDLELDDFMESYCEVLKKYKSDLAKPFSEATTFLNDIQAQFNNLCNGPSRSCVVSDDAVGSSEEEFSPTEIEPQECNQKSEDREIKDELFRKYSGYISSLKHEFSKTKKKGKLPREARQILMDWWTIHYKWPYPTEADKVALAESTGLDQKQINNWFINQRKRHWRPSDDMQFNVMDGLYGQYFMNA